MDRVTLRLSVVETATEWVVDCDSLHGSTTRVVPAPFSGAELDTALRELETSVMRSYANVVTRRATPPERFAREFGQRLTDILLADEARVIFDRCKNQAKIRVTDRAGGCGTWHGRSGCGSRSSGADRRTTPMSNQNRPPDDEDWGPNTPWQQQGPQIPPMGPGQPPPGYQPMPPPGYGYGQAPAQSNTAQTLAIIGIVCILFCGPASIVLGLIAQNKFQQQRRPDTLAKIAWIGGIVSMAIGILYVLGTA